MKKILFFVCTLLCANVLFAQTFEIEGLHYEVTSTNPAEVEVSSANASITTAIIPETVSYGGTDYSVASIGYGAFSYCLNLTSVDIPNSITSIGNMAFYGCKSLTSITIPNSVTYIGEMAFSFCFKLTSITLPNNITTIEVATFQCCPIDNPNIIPDNVTYIGGNAFTGCSRLDFINIPSNVTYIDSYAFSMCSNLRYVNFENPSDDLVINSNAFFNSGGIGNEIKYIPIGNYTFNVNIGSNNYTFNNPGYVGFFENNMGYGNYRMSYNEDVDFQVAPFCSYNLNEIEIPSIVSTHNVSAIGDYAFFGNENITSITIPSSIISIGRDAFCQALRISDDNLNSITCLAEIAPTKNIWNEYSPLNMHYNGISANKTLTIPFGSDYSSWQNDITANITKTNYLIQEGETKELSNDFTINSTTGLINKGVLRIKQSGQLINSTGINVRGIFEVETPTLANDKWSFIGAPFNNYKLEVVKPGSEDISISLFDYTTGNWSEDFATIEDVVGAGEGFFAWSFAEEPTVFTTYGDGAETYNFENTPEYALNNGAVTVTKNLKTYEGGNWLALSNPYTFKLDVEKFLSEHGDIKGGVVYRFNGETWDDVQAGVINMTEGFFVNYETAGAHGVSFSKYHRPGGAKKAETKKDYMKLLVNDGERTTKLLITQNEEAEQGDDIFDANKLFSPLEITEPYFVTDGVALVKEEVKEYPYTATLNIRNYETKEVTISIDNIPEGVNVFLLDNGQDIKMNGGVEYTTTITEGENADRFKVLFKKQHRLEKINDNQITITNNNRQISVKSDISDLHIEVYNQLGQKVFSTNEYNFTLSTQPAGSYVIKAYQGRYSKSKKIVIE